MTLNEILLILAFIAALIVPSLVLKRIKQPLNTYIKLTSGLFLLVLVWFFATDAALAIKVLMTTFIISSAIKTIKDYKGELREKEAEKH